jgi:hypothetical protein
MARFVVITSVTQIIDDAAITTREVADTTAAANITIGASASVVASRKGKGKVLSGDLATASFANQAANVLSEHSDWS